MLHRLGFTLFEIIVVLIIIAICTALALPNFTTPTEQARALNAWNNLLAIYSAQQNYRNNNGIFAIAANGVGDAHNLSAIDATLNLNIQDDGTYLYACSGSTCTATRYNTAVDPVITLTLNLPIQINGNGNPSCVSTSSWCP